MLGVGSRHCASGRATTGCRSNPSAEPVRSRRSAGAARTTTRRLKRPEALPTTGGALCRGEHVARAQEQLERFVRDVVADAVASGDLRDDAASEELAAYCLHALSAAAALPSKAAVRRLVAITLSGLRPET